jgi:hypothetical protein
MGRLQTLLVEYGSIALWVYFIIFAIVLFGLALALRFGIKIHGLAGTAGIWAGAYVGTKLCQPLRILATLALTPAVAAVVRRRDAKRSGNG